MAFGVRASQLGKMLPPGIAEVIDSYLSLEPVMEPNRLEVSNRLGRPDLDAVGTYDQGRLRSRLLSGELQLLTPCKFTAHLPVGDRWRPVAGVSAARIRVAWSPQIGGSWWWASWPADLWPPEPSGRSGWPDMAPNGLECRRSGPTLP